MACVVPSRFSWLKPVEDDFIEKQKDAKNKKNEPAKCVTKKSEDKKTKVTVKPSKQTAKPSGTSGRKKHTAATEAQWEQWKRKDTQLADGHFQDDLQQALLLSKLDFEEKKAHKTIKKESDTEQKLQEQTKVQGSKRQKKNKTVTLSQFYDGAGDHDVHRADSVESILRDPAVDDSTFFERMKREAGDEIAKNNLSERKKQRVPPSDDEIKGSRLQGLLDEREREIRLLKTQVDNLKMELLKVKSRNKKLCSIIGQGEMKDKAEVLVEVERLREVQSELTAEVAALHAQLEQERSRHHQPKADKKKRPEKDT